MGLGVGECQEAAHPSYMGTEAPALGTFPDLTLCTT